MVFFSNNWLNDISRSSSTSYSGDYSSRFCSKEAVFDPFGVQTQDQYMISPKLNVGEGETFSFWHDQSDWSGEKFMVGISTTDQSLEYFTYGPEFTRENGSAGVWVQHVEDLSDYEGQEIYVSIRYTSFWKHYLYIDHVEGPSIVLEPEPDAYLSADTLNFPLTYIQSSSSLDLIIGNGGEGDLIGTLTSNNSHFEIGNFDGTVLSGEEEIITITYTPSEAHNQSDGSFDYDEGYVIFTNSETGESDQIYVKEVAQMTLYLKVLKMNSHHLVGQYFQIIQTTVLHNQIRELILVFMQLNLIHTGQPNLVTIRNI